MPNLGKTLDLDTFFANSGISTGPSQLAVAIAGQWNDWSSYRINWLSEKHELRDYLFATDTRSTTNQKLPWKNSTTVPKLTQIRDNLHANYLFALFPNRDWLRWEADTADDAVKEKASAIQDYIQTKIEQDDAITTISALLLDYIDYGNCFATVKWISEAKENPETGEVIPGYVGPRIERLNPQDITFNPLATRFKETPKITRSLMFMGELAKKINRLPNGEYKSNLEQVLNNSVALRKQAATFQAEDSLVADELNVDGFGSFQLYLQSDYIEVLTFMGDLYDVNEMVLKENHIIEVVDRSFIVRDEPDNSWAVSDMIHHAGWRQRSHNLYAMGPLDNLVGMQYRIDHLENLKADVFDMIAFPVQKVRGFVEDYEYEPGTKIFVGDDGDVEFMSPDVTALNADTQIAELQRRMEELAGAPREAMGIRSPGEKTAFEVQTLDNAASRLFLNKVQHFERVFLEPLLNDMLAVARQNMDGADTVRSMSREVDAIVFSKVTKDDINARGTLRPRGASHFAQRANKLQNVLNLLNSAAVQDPSISVHLSGKKIAKLLEEISDLGEFDIFGNNARVIEQQETQQLINAAGEQAELAQATPPGITDADTPVE